MSETLARPRPQIDHPQELERMVRQIVERVDPVAIYLFGSRARGQARKDSDYDLLVVLPGDAPPDQVTPSSAMELVAGRRIPMDVVLVREPRFAWRSRAVGTLSYKVAREGVPLYGR